MELWSTTFIKEEAITNFNYNGAAAKLENSLKLQLALRMSSSCRKYSQFFFYWISSQ